MPPSDLLALIVVIAIGFFIAVAFYESLCYRDVLVARVLRFAHRATARRWVHRLAYVLVVAVGLPVLVVVWVVVIELVLMLIGTADRVRDAGIVAAAIVGATRLLAYIREKTSHELAKALPLALAFALITGSGFNLQQKAAAFEDPASLSTLTPAMLLLLIALEIGLRILADGSNAVLGYARNRRGIESDAGVWATLRIVIQRPFHTAIESVARRTKAIRA
jgi:hypothetical protein